MYGTRALSIYSTGKLFVNKWMSLFRKCCRCHTKNQKSTSTLCFVFAFDLTYSNPQICQSDCESMVTTLWGWSKVNNAMGEVWVRMRTRRRATTSQKLNWIVYVQTSITSYVWTYPQWGTLAPVKPILKVLIPVISFLLFSHNRFRFGTKFGRQTRALPELVGGAT